MLIKNKKALLLGLFSILLVSCGGGGSSSGSGVSVPIIIVQNGVYSGTRTFEFFGAGIGPNSTVGSFSLSVTGQGGSQQVRLAFNQFSGSSAIGINQDFSIPSGTFQFNLSNNSGLCTGSTRFDGRFIGTSASGTEAGSFTCQNIQGSVGVRGTFQLSLGAAKQSAGELEYGVEY